MRPGAPDDDPASDWSDEAARTILDGAPIEAAPAATSEPITAPHDVQRLPGYDIGRRDGRQEKARVCYTEGQEDGLRAVRMEMLDRGLTPDEVGHFLLAARTRLVKL